MLGYNNVGQPIFSTPAGAGDNLFGRTGVGYGSVGSLLVSNPATNFATSGAAIANRAAYQPELWAPGSANGFSLFNRRFNGNVNTRRGLEAGATYTNMDADIANRAFTGPATGPSSYVSKRVRELDIRRMRALGPYPSALGYPYGYSYGLSGYLGGPYAYNGNIGPYIRGYPYNVPYPAIANYTGIGVGSPYGIGYGAGFGNPGLYPNGYPIYGTLPYYALGQTLSPYGGPFFYPPASPECAINLGCAAYSNPNDCRSCVVSRGGTSHCANQICGPHVL